MILKNWRFWLILLILIIVIVWFKYGGKDYEFVGLKPLYQTRQTKPSVVVDDTPSNLVGVSRLIPQSSQPPSKPASRSKGEKICCEVLEKIYNKPFTTVRPKWLKNPETGSNLEIDCYNDELKIGCEYNGTQHYKFPNPFHTNEKDFIKQVRRDRYKFDTCEKYGVYIITVPYTVPHNKIEEYIRDRLPDRSDGNVCQR